MVIDVEIYKTAIMPYLTYCHLVWHYCKASDTRKVERIQERALMKPFVVNKTLVLQTTNLGSLGGAWPSDSASLRPSFASNLPVLGLFSTVSCRTISLVLKFVITKQRSGQRTRLRAKFNRPRYQPCPPYCFALP